MVRIRTRTFLRNTRLVSIVGAIVLAGAIWAALHLTLAPTQMRVAAGPPGSAEVKLVEMLGHRFAVEHAKVQFHLVATDGPRASAAALAGGDADLAVVPSTLRDAIDWPVIAILRKNVMALIVPAPPLPAKPGTYGESAAGAADDKAGKPDPAAESATAAKLAGKQTAKTPDKDADTGDTAAKENNKDDKAGADANKLDSIVKLAARRIGVVTGNAATPEVLGVVLSHYGVPLDQVQMSPVDPSHVADAVKARDVDVLFVAGAETGQAINDVVAASTVNGRAPSFIPIDQAKGMAKRFPAFQSVDIEAGTFGGHRTASRASPFPNTWWQSDRFTMTRSERCRS